MNIVSDKTFIERWKMRNLIKQLKSSKGNGTSMISLLIKPGQQITQISNMLKDEFGTATNIKSRVNRLSVRAAITSTIERLKLYSKTPTNGLIIFCGYAQDSSGREKKITIDFEPFKPLTNSLYHCDNCFHTSSLESMLNVDEFYGFVIISGQQALFAQINGDFREILRSFNVELPKKHNKGGQSAARYQRLRVEKRNAFIKKTAETANQLFVDPDGTRLKVRGIVVGGPASLKNDFATEAVLDFRLKKAILKIVDTSYGGEEGFKSTLEQAQDVLKGVKLVEEKKLLENFFEGIRIGNGKVCFGAKKVCEALEMGAVEKIVLYEDLNFYRVVVSNSALESISKISSKENNNNNGEREREKEKIMYLKENDLYARNINFEGEIKQKEKIAEYIIENLKSFGGAELVLVTKNTSEGKQFIEAFSGIGAFLKYRIENDQNEICGEGEESSCDEEYDY